MKYRPGIMELLDSLETELDLLNERKYADENIGKIKALSLALEERLDELYRRMKRKNKKYENPEIFESRTETCVCGKPWIYENAGLCQVFGRCRDEYCFINIKSEA